MSSHQTKRPAGVRCTYPAGVQPEFPLGCEGLDAAPNGLTVQEAGTAACNGTYSLSPTLVNGKHWWVYGTDYKVSHNGLTEWVLTDYSGENTYYSATNSEDLPPTSGWVPGVGSSPAPTMSYVYD